MAAIHSSTNSNSHHGRVHGAKTGEHRMSHSCKTIKITTSNQALLQGRALPWISSFKTTSLFSSYFPFFTFAKLWCDENLPADRMTFGHGIVIEVRYSWPIL